MDRDDVKTGLGVAAGGIIFYYIGKFAYKYPKCYFAFFGLGLLSCWYEQQLTGHMIKIVTTFSIMFWFLVNIVAMFRHAIKYDGRPYSAVASTFGLGCIFILYQATIDAMNDARTSDLVFDWVLIGIIGSLIAVAVIRHRREINQVDNEGDYLPNVYLPLPATVTRHGNHIITINGTAPSPEQIMAFNAQMAQR